MRTLLALIRDRSGATAIEYALVAALVPVTALAGLHQLGFGVESLYARILSAMQAAFG